MRARLLFFAATLLVSIAVQASEIRSDSVSSTALGRPYRFTVYLPDGYPAKGAGRYPVIYLLHGANGDENEWLEKGHLREAMDRLLAERKVAPMVVVMPGHNAGWWVNGAAEKGETALLTELVPAVEERYCVRTDRGGRMFAGDSAGGYAVTRMAFKYPELFVAGAALSPAIYREGPPATSSARKQAQFQKDGSYDDATWRSLNYPRYVEQYRNQPLRVPLYINSGDHDKFGIVAEAKALYEIVDAVQPGKNQLVIVPGDHEWPVWASTIAEAVQFMSRWIEPPAKDVACAASAKISSTIAR